MVKKILITLFFSGLIILFAYGYIQVYTNSYNATHREHIVGFDISYNDKNIHIVVCGKTYDFNIL